MEMCGFYSRFHWNLFLRLESTIFQHWPRWWLGVDQATCHYLNQWWIVYWRIYMRRWTGSALIKVMACRLFGAKALPEPMLVYCQLDTCEQISAKFKSEFYYFHSRKCIWSCSLPQWRPFCPGGHELRLGGLALYMFVSLFMTPITEYTF